MYERQKAVFVESGERNSDLESDFFRQNHHKSKRSPSLIEVEAIVLFWNVVFRTRGTYTNEGTNAPKHYNECMKTTVLL